MFGVLNRFISKLDATPLPDDQQSLTNGAYGFQVLRNGSPEVPLEPWFDFIIGINGRTIVRPPSFSLVWFRFPLLPPSPYVSFPLSLLSFLLETSSRKRKEAKHPDPPSSGDESAFWKSSGGYSNHLLICQPFSAG